METPEIPKKIFHFEKYQTNEKIHDPKFRFNWYRDSSEWKPFHHDAAAVKEDKGNLHLKLNFLIFIEK